MSECGVCFRHCNIPEGKKGFCGVRTCREGVVVPLGYGKISSLALDPIEKKPLRRFYPGSVILSVGGFGCNLRCPFCQNSSISWLDNAMRFGGMYAEVTPGTLLDIAIGEKEKRGNIGMAFTYNEPLVGYEFVRDTARLIHDAGMKNVLVTNGTAELSVLEELLPYIDAMNIDLKSFSEECYRDTLGGSLPVVKSFIERAVRSCHVELTVLTVPGMNDTREHMRELCAWVAGLTDGEGKTAGRQVPLHISRFFPRFHMTDREATDVSLIYSLADTAREYLEYVYTGNC